MPSTPTPSTLTPSTRRAASIKTTVATALLAGALALPSTSALAESGRTVTDALIWAGASERVARRSVDRRDRRAIRAVERRIGGYEDGWLDRHETRVLMTMAERARAREGYRVVEDPATGVRVGLPTAWLGRRQDRGEGSLWRSPDGAITVETFALRGGLDAFERRERRRNGVDATYVAGEGRWRVVSGYAPGGRTVYARAVPHGGRTVGFRVTYETALRDRLDRVAVAMSSDFRAPTRTHRTDALAYAPSDVTRDDRFDDRFDAIEPRYAVLPKTGPAPRERPVVASLEPVRPALDEVRRDVRPDPVPPRVEDRRIVERERPVAPVGPIGLDEDERDLALDPVRGDVVPDDGSGEAPVPTTITGLVTDEGQSCPTLRGPDGTLYALVGEVPQLAPGTLVSVEAVGVDTERCSAGRTVAVGGLQVRSSPQ